MLTKKITGAHRPLSTIAHDIWRNWPKPYFGAIPYIVALESLTTINDAYGDDSARSVVLYFLANAATWRGDAARAIKAELKGIAGIK
jgi:hypothetical protein